MQPVEGNVPPAVKSQPAAGFEFEGNETGRKLGAAFRFGDKRFFTLARQGFDGAFPGQGPGPGAAFLAIDQIHRPAGSGVAGSFSLPVHLEPPLDVGGHTGVKGSVAATEDIEKPGGADGRFIFRPLRPGFHSPEHPAVTGFHEIMGRPRTNEATAEADIPKDSAFFRSGLKCDSLIFMLILMLMAPVCVENVSDREAEFQCIIRSRMNSREPGESPQSPLLARNGNDPRLQPFLRIFSRSRPEVCRPGRPML